MNQPGMGVMLHLLGGGSKHDPKEYYGRKIVEARTGNSPEQYNSLESKDRGSLVLKFEDGVTVKLWDNGQSCCESRYMTTDDDPASLVGQTLVTIETRECSPPKPKDEDDWGHSHEVVAVIVQGDKSAVTIFTHNEHNGYYGGFGLTLTEEKTTV